MNSFPYRQRGVTLLVALVMLLVMTVLGISSMRGVSLESRITGNRAESLRLYNTADAALREAEFRFYGPGKIRDKLEPNTNNCTKTNKLKSNGANAPCLLRIEEADDASRLAFMKDPLDFLKNDSSWTWIGKKTGAATATAGNSDPVSWMPYRGLVPGDDQKTGSYYNAYWNAHLIALGANDSGALNAEYGAVMEGRGTYYYLINGQADDRVAVQSTIANVYVGLNN